MRKRLQIIGLVLAVCWTPVFADFPLYPSNPFSFPILEPVAGDNTLGVLGDQFFASDLNGDGLPDYSFRSMTKLYAYDHDGSLMWQVACSNPQGNGGARHGAADVDGDGGIEIVAVTAENTLIIYDAESGTVETIIPIDPLGYNQHVGHVLIANLRGEGDRDAIVQTLDKTLQTEGVTYYINRALIAINLENGEEIWRVDQDDNVYNGLYQGYWGQAHGPAFCADVDEDGLDEVVGGNLIEEDGSVVGLGYPTGWLHVDINARYVDHFDAISVGDYRTDLPGLEWIVLEENDTQKSFFHTTLMDRTGLLWSVEAEELLTDPTFYRDPKDWDKALEPQNVVVGNFDPERPHREVWNRSRFVGTGAFSQHPWIYDGEGRLIAHYRTDQTLPAGFNTHVPDGNAEGIEMIWAIDWAGGEKEYIAAKARHVVGEAGIFDALTGQAIFRTGADRPSVSSAFIYVADVCGDGREEMMLCDLTDEGPVMRIYTNDAVNQASANLSKWEDPLYRRLKQNWNYYSPGSYTQRDVMLVEGRLKLEGFLGTDGRTMHTDLNREGLIPEQSPYEADPRMAFRIPDDMVDWVLIQLSREKSNTPEFERSGLLLADGRIVSEHDFNSAVPFFIPPGSYYVTIRHRNHFPVRSSDPVLLDSWQPAQIDFSVPQEQVGNPESMKSTGPGTWAVLSGDVNQDGLVTINDKNHLSRFNGSFGYLDADLNGDGLVSALDLDLFTQNRNTESGLDAN